MHWTIDALDRLARGPHGYHAADPPAAEPTAMAALALIGADRLDDVRPSLDWLQSAQVSDGSVPPYSDLKGPGWPTPLAVITAAAAERRTSAAATLSGGEFGMHRARQWLLSAAGNALQKSPAIGHDVTLVGWPWVIGTHSWQEPTAWSVLALKAIGLSDHARTREGVRLLVDRLLPDGGCNYGNTWVLGQFLRPHVEPTGITMLALAGEKLIDLRIERSLAFLERSLSSETTPMSLSYGLLGLAAHDRSPGAADDWLAAAYEQTAARDASPFLLALLVLASQGRQSPLLDHARAPRSQPVAAETG